MLRETGVIAAAGLRRLIFACWAIACVLMALIFIVIGGLKLLGLAGAMAMLTLDGMVPAKDAAQNATVHIIFMLLFFAIGCLFIYWFRLAKRSLSTPFERDIKIAAEMVNDIESSTKTAAGSIRDAARAAISEAKSFSVKDQE